MQLDQRPVPFWKALCTALSAYCFIIGLVILKTLAESAIIGTPEATMKEVLLWGEAAAFLITLGCLLFKKSL